MKFTACLLTGISLFALPMAVAHAEPPNAREGLFLGLSVGGSAFDTGPIGRLEQSSASGGTAARVRAGFWFSRHWGVEAGYTDLGSVEQSYVDGVFRGDSRSIHLSGLARLPLGERWSLIGKLTVAANQTDERGSTGNTTDFDRLSGSGGGLVFPELGIEYAVNQNLAVTVGAGPMGRSGKESSVGFAGIGLRWQF